MIQRLDMIFQFGVLWSLGSLIEKNSMPDFFYAMKSICSTITKLDKKR
jgi:hypothetical protein